MRFNTARVGVLHPSGSEASAVPASLAFPSKAALAKRSMTPGSVRKFWLSASLRWIDACARDRLRQKLRQELPGCSSNAVRRCSVNCPQVSSAALPQLCNLWGTTNAGVLEAGLFTFSVSSFRAVLPRMW